MQLICSRNSNIRIFDVVTLLKTLLRTLFGREETSYLLHSATSSKDAYNM